MQSLTSFGSVFDDIIHSWLKTNIYSIFTFIIGVWLIIELIFYYLVKYYLVPNLNQFENPLPYDMDAIHLINKILDDIDGLDSYTTQDFIQGFFLGTKIEDLHEKNIKSFLAWVMYGIKNENLSISFRKNISIAYSMICERFSLNPKPGFNENIKHISHSWDDLSYMHRPFWLYVVSNLFDYIFSFVVFRIQGFKYYEMKNIRYWYYAGNHVSNAEATPFLFLHGITPG